MNHSFNVELAQKYSIEEAIIIQNFYFWIIKNRANNKNYYKGRYWTYNSQAALAELFPYWNRKKICRILLKAEENNLILKDNFNKSNYDRTIWYSLSDLALNYLELRTSNNHDLQKNKEKERSNSNIGQNSPIEKKEVSNRKEKSVQPIPYINTYNKNIYSSLSNEQNAKNLSDKGKTETKEQLIEVFTKEIWNKYPKKQGKTSITRSLTKLRELVKNKDKVIKAINNYIAYVDKERKTNFPNLQYKNGSTFFNNWMDYYEIEQETENKAQNKKSSFLNSYYNN